VFASSAEASIPLAVDAVRRGAFDFIYKAVRCPGYRRAGQCRFGRKTSRFESGMPADLWNTVPLTARESEVLERIALGESNKEIAQALGLSSRTVEGYRANILRKAGVGSTTELVRRVFGQNGRP
jgi:FixJ family two-component response regulator